MSSFVQVNFFKTTLSAAITSSSTSIALGSTAGAPTIPSGSYWPLILSANNVYEIVYVSALSGSTATVLRAQEGTAAQGWASGSTVFGAFTAGSVLYLGGNLPFSALTGTLGDTQILSGAVTQFQSDLAIDGSQISGSIDVTGTITATSFNSTSDERLKTDILPIDNALARAMAIRGVYFAWKSTGAKSAGVLAQQVKEVLPEAVRESADGVLHVDPMALIGLLFAAFGELTHNQER